MAEQRFSRKEEAHMRVAIAAISLLMLAGCQVSKDNNGTVSVTYNSDAAQNAAADVGNTAQNVANDIGSDVKTEGSKVENRIGNDKSSNSSNESNTEENQ